MKLGTQIRLPDGREGTVVFNSLFGVGIKWGLHNPDPEDFVDTSGSMFRDDDKPESWPWRPDALLRVPFRKDAFVDFGFSDENCVGENYEIIGSEEGGGENKP